MAFANHRPPTENWRLADARSPAGFSPAPHPANGLLPPTFEETLFDAVLVLNPNLTIRRINRAARELLGYTSGELAGISMTHILGHSVSETINLYRLIKEGRDRIETAFFTFDGRRIPVLASISIIPDKRGGVDGIVCLAHDLSTHRKIEAELAEARDAAMQIAARKSRFLAHVAHEIRTPINGILGMAGLLLDSALSPDQREFADTIAASAESLIKLVNDLLDLAKIEAGKLTLESLKFDVRTVVDETLELLALKAHQKGLELIGCVSPEVPGEILGDPGRLRQILINLVSNAVKFTDEGEVVVCVEVAGETTLDGRIPLAISVRDTGIGMDAAQCARLFQPFAQGEVGYTRKLNGTGLGLSICRQLVKLMGGTIEATSAPGNGSTFALTATFILSSSFELPENPASADNWKHIRVMVADDSATVRKMLGEQMAAWGVDFVAVRNADEARTVLRRATAAGKPINVALLDLEMPNMTGLELAQEIVEDPRIGEIAMALMVPFAHRESAEGLQAAGILGQLTKPLRMTAVADCVAKLCGDEISFNQPRESLARHHTTVCVDAVHPARLLVVDDDPVNRRAALGQLRKLGYAADVAENGREAVEKISAGPVDLVLMDCEMPEMDGLAATAEIRRLEINGHRTPIVAMTANVADDERNRCLAAGMDDYLAKPVRATDLVEVLARWLPSDEPLDLPALLPIEYHAPPPPENPSDSFDSTALEDIRELAGPDSPNFAAEMIELFLNDTPAHFYAMRTALLAGDMARVAERATTVQGSCRAIGARRLEMLAGELIVRAHPIHRDACTNLLALMEDEFATARTWFQARNQASDA